MPDWTRKDERQYDRIKRSSRRQGKSLGRAKEIAARTVNRQRRAEGRTPNRRTTGTGNPRRGLEDRSVDQLRNRARELNISGRSKMKKSDLIRAIRRR